jgi:tetratricopeptide (TPR) repeat protein
LVEAEPKEVIEHDRISRKQRCLFKDRITAATKMLPWVILCTVVLALSWPAILRAEDNAVDMFEKGKSLLNKGNYAQAIEIFSKVAGLLDPSKRNAQVVILAKAKAHLAQGDLKDALKDINQVIGAEGIEGEILASGLQLRSAVNLHLGREKQALQDLTAAIKVTHDSDTLRSLCFANRGMTFTKLGDSDRAISDLNKAIELDPKSSFAYACRAEAYLRHDHIERARKDSEQALQLSPDEHTTKIAEKVLEELSVSASGPSTVSVSMGIHGDIYVQVYFSKKGKPHRFLLDTGATYSLVDRDLLAEIMGETEVKPMGRGMVSIADGTIHPVTRYKVKTAFLYNLPLGEIEIHVFEKKGKRIPNLVGTKSLRNVSFSIDNSQRKVEITRKTD